LQYEAFKAFNEYGFLRDPKAWSKEIANQIAQKEGLDRLDETHWKISVR
jgi:sulfur relay (sulfurtransferase) DsrC/TusE family protein